ncbi:hypothetical protein LCGC14_1213940 [marine sediment metagenome]|uniref:Uncharacterized protein n=1 Tax=marine sediment metagenome TaxID=412755 RepID=A0A0F9NVJ7_9ZZZZ
MSNQYTRYATIATVDTPGEGGFYGGTAWAPAAGGSTQTIVVANDVAVYQFVLPFRSIVRNITFNVNTLEAGKFAGVGLYDKDRNRLVHSGAVSVAATGPKSTAVAAVILEPGVYFHAWTADGTTGALFAVAGVSDGTGGAMSARVVPAKIGIAANPGVAGVLPATLGVITTNLNLKLPVTYFEP